MKIDTNTLTRVTRGILRKNNGYTIAPDGTEIPIWIPTQVLDDETGDTWICNFEPLARKIRPAAGGNTTGRYPMGPARGGSIPFESRDEEWFLTLMDRFPELVSVTAQPLTVTCHLGNRRLWYTADYLVELTEVPPELRKLGFDVVTFVEVKPDSKVDETVRFKAAMLETYAGITTVIVTESQILAALDKGVSHVR